MQILALLKTFIYLVASSIFLPVLLILSCLVLWMLVYSGSFLRMWIQRRRMEKETKDLPVAICSGKFDNCMPATITSAVRNLETLHRQNNPQIISLRMYYHKGISNTFYNPMLKLRNFHLLLRDLGFQKE